MPIFGHPLALVGNRSRYWRVGRKFVRWWPPLGYGYAVLRRATDRPVAEGSFMGVTGSAASLPPVSVGRLTVSTLMLFALAVPASAESVQTDEEIIVTARRRAEVAENVPVSLSVIDGKAIEAHDLRNTTDLTARSPNLLAPANSVAIGAPTFFIRGVGQGDRNWNNENGVAVFIDDVYVQSMAGAWVDLADMDRMEILRGPQGTLYGRNSTSGAIKFVPRPPDPLGRAAYAELTLGEAGRVDVKVGANLPFDGGRGAIRINLYDIRDNGSLTRVDTANRPITDRLARIHHRGARLATLWQPRARLEFELNGDIVHQDDGMRVVTPIVPADPAGITSLNVLLSKRGTVDFVPLYGVGRAALEPLTVGGMSRLTGGGVVFKVRLDTGLGRLSSISAWRHYDEHFVSQLGGRSTPSTLLGVTLFGNVNTVYEKVSQVSEELQLTGEWRSLASYTVGAYFFHNRWRESEYGATNGVPANF